MNASDIQTGKPKTDGRYLCFIPCQSAQVREWVEPVIMVWHSGKWQSTFMPQSNVAGWIGPIPVLKVSDLKAVTPAQEFDL